VTLYGGKASAARGTIAPAHTPNAKLETPEDPASSCSYCARSAICSSHPSVFLRLYFFGVRYWLWQRDARSPTVTWYDDQLERAGPVRQRDALVVLGRRE